MLKIHSDKWVPIGGLSFDLVEMEAITYHGNVIIIAGPGAGKTEVLAQRACYLLETDLKCRYQGILAISFKTDSAFNLAERLERRANIEIKKKFHSIILFM